MPGNSKKLYQCLIAGIKAVIKNSDRQTFLEEPNICFSHSSRSACTIKEVGSLEQTQILMEPRRQHK